VRTINFHLRILMAKWAERHGETLTFRHLSEQTGISTNTLSHLAKNDQTMIGLSVIERLCDFFNCGLCEFMTLDEPRPKGAH